jgi:hypothetical protein
MALARVSSSTTSGESRSAFRAGLDLDEETWARGRRWALWKALNLRAGLSETTAVEFRQPDAVLTAVLVH